MRKAHRLAPLVFSSALAAVAIGLSSPCGASAAESAAHRTGAATPLFRSGEASAPPELAISFEDASVVAGKLSPGGDALFFGVARRAMGTFHRVERYLGAEIVDAQGEARLALEEALAPKAAWAVVDLETGAFRLAAPEGFELVVLPFPGEGFEAGAVAGRVDRLEHPVPWVDLVLVRPKVGAWSLRAADGSEQDRDRDRGGGARPGRVVTGLEDLEPLAGGPEPPEEYAAGDVLLVIDPLDLRVYATRLDRVPEPGRRP